MMTVSMTQLRRRLTFYLEQVKKGETIVICERGVPVAKIVRLRPDEVDELSVDG